MMQESGTREHRMKSLQGHLLLASPDLRDPNFVQSVVLMVQHNAEGALGLILNRPTDTTISEAWNQVSDSLCERHEVLHHGGPCESPLMVLHNQEVASQIQVSEDIYFSTEKENVEWLVDQQDNTIKFFVGCAGWGPGQLESELETGSWLTTPATLEHVFQHDEHQWEKVTEQIICRVTKLVINPKLIPKDPSMN